MKKNNTDYKELQAILENLELPEVQMPVHQRQLRETLLASNYFKKESAPVSIRQKIYERINWTIEAMKPKIWKPVASLAVLILVLGVYLAFFTPPRVVATLVLQVSPAISLTISERNTVIGAEGLDAAGELILEELDLRGQEVQDALGVLAGALDKADWLSPGCRILLALHPVGGRLAKAELDTLTDTARQALSGYLTEQSLPVEIKTVAITEELVDMVLAVGILPADYIDLVAMVGPQMTMQVLNLQKRLSLDPALFKEELGATTASLIDMKEIGITGDNAFAILEKVLTIRHEKS
jgi:hypothetical protein